MGRSTEPKAALVQRYSIAKTKVAVLLADPMAKAVLDKHFPDLSASERFSAAGDMTLRTLRIFAPEQFTDELLAAAETELRQLETGQGAVRHT